MLKKSRFCNGGGLWLEEEGEVQIKPNSGESMKVMSNKTTKDKKYKQEARHLLISRREKGKKV